jgi:hypothetical protein
LNALRGAADIENRCDFENLEEFRSSGVFKVASPFCHRVASERVSSVGTATGRSGGRIPVGVRFSAPFRTGPGAHPTYYTKGAGSFPGVKRPGRGVDHPSHLAPRLKKK